MNTLIIENFKKLIKLISVETEALPKTNSKEIIMNNFRIKSLKKVVSILSKLNFEIKSSDQVKSIPGIGKSSIQRIDEILKTGTLFDLKSYDRIVKKTSEKLKSIEDLMNVVGIGKVMATTLVTNYKIKSANDLKLLVDKGKNIPPVVNDKIKLGLKYLGKFEGSIPRAEIDKIYDYLQNLTDQFDSNMFITICGSYRRELPTSSDIDVLLTHMNLITNEDIIQYNTSKFNTKSNNLNSNLLSSYVDYLHKKNILIDDITDKNIKTKYMGFGMFKSLNLNKIRRIDIRLIPMVSYWPALLYFTGSYDLNQTMRLKAKKLGYKLNEYGLYDLRTNEMIVVTSEQEIFEKLEMNYVQPNQR
jgi:DNA polymerase/3'-5' exonuclease PolX